MIIILQILSANQIYQKLQSNQNDDRIKAHGFSVLCKQTFRIFASLIDHSSFKYQLSFDLHIEKMYDDDGDYDKEDLLISLGMEHVETQLEPD